MLKCTSLKRVTRRFVPSAATSVIILLTAAAAWLWAHPNHAPLPTKGVFVDILTGQIVLSKEARDALDIRSAEIINQPLPDKLLAYASVVAPWQNHAFASSRLPGRIESLQVKPGQVVKAGEVLAEVRSGELETLQLEMLNAKTESELSGKVLKGFEEAARGGSIAFKEMLEAKVKHQQSLIGLEITKGKWLSLDLPQSTLDTLVKEGVNNPVTTLPIRSPITGTVIHADLSVGRVIEASEHLFEIVDLSTVWVKIGVLEKDLRRVQSGQRVEIQLAAYPGKLFESTITFKGIYLDPQTHLNSVWAKLENKGSQPEFLPGMAGQAQIVLPAAPSAKTVPADALVNDGVDRYVLVEEANATGKSEYRKRSVIVLRETPEWVEIQSADLLPGDRVVTQGSPQLGGLLVSGVLKLTPQMERTIGLRVEEVTSQNVDDVVTIEGSVDVPPNQRGFASAQIAGSLDRIRIEPGQPVVAGQVVAEIASLELQNLQLELLKEHLTYELLNQQFEQIQNNKTILPQRTYIELESSKITSRNHRDSLRRRLDMLGLSAGQLDELLKEKKLVRTLPVRAPISGIVCNVDKVLGQAVRAEESLVEIHDLARPWIQGLVSERELNQVGINKSVRVRFVSDPNTVFTGNVVRSAQVIAAENRSLSIWIDLAEYPKYPLQHNQLATISLTVHERSPVLAVPLNAIVREGTQAFVFVRQKDGSFDRRSVTTGRASDLRMEITSGLQASEQIAVAGTAELQTAYASLR